MIYEYRATIERVVDGDTFVAAVDLGFSAWLHAVNFRILGINAREKSDAGGPEARANLTSLLPAGSTVTLLSIKPDKFGGRYDCHVTLPDGRTLSQVLIQTGWAAAWSGAGAKPLPPWPRKVT